MAKSSGPGPSSRFVLIGQSNDLVNALRDTFGKSHDIVQAADHKDALRLIAEGGADVLLLSPAILGDPAGRSAPAETGSSSPDLDPEAIRAIAELLTALARRRT
jgi:hypothetical protein